MSSEKSVRKDVNKTAIKAKSENTNSEDTYEDIIINTLGGEKIA